MSKIVNIPKRNIFFLKAIRKLLEHRATWLYLLLVEGEKRGIKWEDIGYPAIRSCGSLHGKELVNISGSHSLKGLKKHLFTLPAQFVFEMKILESTENILSVDFGYCPLVSAWQKLGCSDDEIEKLCDIAMEGDRGIAESFNGKLELEGTIANGSPTCKLRFHRI